MNLKRYFAAGLLVGLISVIYNYLVFAVFEFLPDVSFISLNLTVYQYFVIIFLKAFFIGIVLSWLFAKGTYAVSHDDEEGSSSMAGVLWFFLYGVFAFVAFILTDLALMATGEGMFLLLTLDGSVETLIVTVCIRFFSPDV